MHYEYFYFDVLYNDIINVKCTYALCLYDLYILYEYKYIYLHMLICASRVPMGWALSSPFCR